MVYLEKSFAIALTIEGIKSCVLGLHQTSTPPVSDLMKSLQVLKFKTSPQPLRTSQEFPKRHILACL